MDTIFIRNLVVRGKHGVSDQERASEQTFELDIAIELDTKAAAASDHLADTVDYNHFRDAAKSVVGGTSYKLIETLGDAVAKEILINKTINSVSVTIRKTDMFDDCTPGVTIVRARN